MRYLIYLAALVYASADLIAGNMNILILFLIAVAFELLRGERLVASSIFFALAYCLKMKEVIFIPALGVMGYLYVGLLSGALALLLTLQEFTYLPSGSFHSFVQNVRHTAFHAGLSNHSLAAWLPAPYKMAFIALVVCLLIRLLLSPSDLRLKCAGVLCADLLLCPLVEDHHFALLVYPLLVLMRNLKELWVLAIPAGVMAVLNFPSFHIPQPFRDVTLRYCLNGWFTLYVFFLIQIVSEEVA